MDTIRQLQRRVRQGDWRQWHSLTLSATQRQILEYLGGDPQSVTVGGIARVLVVSPATTSDSLNALERKKLVHREQGGPTCVDGRAVSVQLTQAGRAYLTELARAPDPLEAALSALSPEDQLVYCKLTERLLKNLPPTNPLPTPKQVTPVRALDTRNAPRNKFPRGTSLAR